MHIVMWRHDEIVVSILPEADIMCYACTCLVYENEIMLFDELFFSCSF